MAYSLLSSLLPLFLFLSMGTFTVGHAEWDVESFARSFTDHVFPQADSKEKDLITSLPGQPDEVNFMQYSGYIAVDSTGKRNLFYYLAEAKQGSDLKPLVLWLSGGPGFSSLGLGAFRQHGPFQVDPTGTSLKINDFAWNRVANILYLDSPVGVGFSYTTSADDYCTGDEMAAIDNYRFLVNWLERFPEFKSHDLYLAGDGYAGNYVPQLANVISFYNKKQKQVINLKGIILGNPTMDAMEDARGRFDYLAGSGIIPDELVVNVTKVCGCPHCSISWECYLALDGARPFLPTYNIKNIYKLPCTQTHFVAGSLMNNAQSMYLCQENSITKFLNLPQVQSALHVRAGASKASWASFRLNVEAAYTTRYNSSIPMLKGVMTAGIPIWIYSGALDSQYPVISTMYSLRLLELKVEKQWRGWYSTDNELSGMTLTYKGNLTLITVNRAGQLVAEKQPMSAFVLFSSIVNGWALPRSIYFFY